MRKFYLLYREQDGSLSGERGLHKNTSIGAKVVAEYLMDVLSKKGASDFTIRGYVNDVLDINEQWNWNGTKWVNENEVQHA